MDRDRNEGHRGLGIGFDLQFYLLYYLGFVRESQQIRKL